MGDRSHVVRTAVETRHKSLFAVLAVGVFDHTTWVSGFAVVVMVLHACIHGISTNEIHGYKKMHTRALVAVVRPKQGVLLLLSAYDFRPWSDRSAFDQL